MKPDLIMNAGMRPVPELGEPAPVAALRRGITGGEAGHSLGGPLAEEGTGEERAPGVRGGHLPTGSSAVRATPARCLVLRAVAFLEIEVIHRRAAWRSHGGPPGEPYRGGSDPSGGPGSVA